MWTIIKKGVMPPDDFIIEGEINRDKYIVEVGWPEEDKWMSEYDSHGVTPAMIGENILGTDAFKDVRFRERTKEDNTWDHRKTKGYSIINNLVSSYINEG
jgi:hypothetical protein